jgi:threonine aldolase
MTAAIIDLRSDTVTRPDAVMRRAMAEADVGDDCYGDDPTVAALERRVAELLGKEAAVFLPTGTMSNQIALRVHGWPGAAVACFPGAHVQIHEDGGAAALAGVQLMPIGTARGFSAAALEALLREERCGWPRVALVWVENTLGHAGGAIWPIAGDGAGLDDVAHVARSAGRPIHLDGARLWNAHVATGVPLSRYGALADTISVCLSKGLGAPMGSVLCGDAARIGRARSLKHAYGGSTRQAGIVAAAGLHALAHNLVRMAEDHRRARALAAALRDLPCWRVPEPETNIVLAETVAPWDAAEALSAPLCAAGVLCHPNSYREVRFVVHLGIDDAAVAEAAARIRRVLSALPAPGR